MSADRPAPDGGGMPPWEQMLRQLLGPAADEALREMKERGLDPAAMAQASGMSADPQLMAAAMQQVQRMLAGSGGDGAVNWEVAHDLARQQAAQGGDPSLTPSQQRAALAALSVAELWLDAVTDLPPATGTPRAWTRAEWVEATLPTWRTLTEPVATSLSSALAETLAVALPEDPAEPGTVSPIGFAVPGAPALPGAPGLGDPRELLRRLGSAVFGMQVGHAAGTLAGEAFGTTDIGLPLVEPPGPALVVTNVDAFAEGLDAPPDEVRHFLALREAASNRLFTHVPWLRAHLLDLVGTYARGISIDLEQLDEAVRAIDPTDAEALRSALSGGVFAPQTTPEQAAALARLETALALVEGWVEEVTAAAALPHLPHAVALREMMRRRRAAGGPAEETFATLVGLELRPRRLRDAAALWARIAADGGGGTRDAVWDHPDLLPVAEDLDDPAGYAARRTAQEEGSADLDRVLAEILDGGRDGGGGGEGDSRTDGNGDDAAGPATGDQRG